MAGRDCLHTISLLFLFKCHQYLLLLTEQLTTLVQLTALLLVEHRCINIALHCTIVASHCINIALKCINIALHCTNIALHCINIALHCTNSVLLCINIKSCSGILTIYQCNDALGFCGSEAQEFTMHCNAIHMMRGVMNQHRPMAGKLPYLPPHCLVCGRTTVGTMWSTYKCTTKWPAS